MSNYIINSVTYDNYLKHHGVKGMKWGIRRSSTKLSDKVSKLQNRNKNLRDAVSIYNSDANKYANKSISMQKHNSKYEKQLVKATGKKAKYDLKLEKQLSRKKPNADKIADYTSKSSKYNAKIMKAQKKIKYNKWAIKSDEAKQAARNAEEKIKKNERTIKVYNSTIKALDENKVKQGRLFMQYVYE